MTPLPSLSPVPRRRARLRALTAAAVLLLAALLVGPPPVITGEARAADGKPTYDAQWTHTLNVITASNVDSSKVPAVYLLGGSSARDSTGTDKSWAAQVRRLGGPRVRTYNLGTNAETYARDIAMVNDLPAGPSIVLIGVGLGRYTQTPVAGVTGSVDSPATRSPGRHPYHLTHVLTEAQKRSLVRAWVTNRYPFFEKNFAGNAVKLDQLVATCQALDLHPVLLELPLNMKIVGRAFNKPRIRYRDSCRKLAKKYGIPNISFLRRAHLASRDFADLFHLVQPGRDKWQPRLSKTVIALLKRYDMGSR